MHEQYVVAVDGLEITEGPVARWVALRAAIAILDSESPGSEIVIAESRTLHVVACWRRDACGFRLAGAIPGWLGASSEPGIASVSPVTAIASFRRARLLLATGGCA